MRNCFAIVCATALMVAHPALASDFSKMAEPAFARSMLLSPERQMEVNCAVIAYLPFRKVEVLDVLEEIPPEEPMADTGGSIEAATHKEEAPPEVVFEMPLSEEQAENLRAAVLARLRSDIGDDERAFDTFEMRFGAFAPDWDYSAETIAIKAENRGTLAEKCEAIFDAAGAGQLEIALSPASAAPIALPDVDTCLAYDLVGKKSKYYADYAYLHQEGDGETLYQQLLGPRGKMRRAREKQIATLAASLTELSPDNAALRLMPCLSTFSAALRK
jgi:hypothetical protein